MKEKIKIWWTTTRRRVKILVIGGPIILFIIVMRMLRPDPNIEITSVVQKDLQKTVLASGTIVSKTDLSLAFDTAGTIRRIQVAVGDKVKEGAVLAELENGAQRAAVTQARGSLLAAQARYRKVLDGASNEEIAVAQADVNAAQINLEQTKKLQDALVENARRVLNSSSLVAQIVGDIPSSATPTIAGTYTGEPGVYKITNSGGSYVSISGIESGVAKISSTTPQALGTKGLTIIFPVNAVSSGLTWDIAIPNISSGVYTANLNTYQSAKNTRDQSVASAQSQLEQKNAALALKRATARQADVDAALADVLIAQAGLASSQATLEKTIIRAPAPGTITNVINKFGESVQPQKEVVVLQDTTNMYLEAKISESSIKDLAVGQSATFYFDSNPDTKNQGSVISIDPAATTNTDGSVSYTVKISLDSAVEAKPGMTANISILTKEVKNVFAIPKKFLTMQDGTMGVSYVTNPKRQTAVFRPVQIGVEADGALVEIIEGLTMSDKVLWRKTK